MKAIERGALLASALTCAACTPQAEPATQVIVLVGGMPDIDALDVSVLSVDRRKFWATRNVALRPRPGKSKGLPTSFVIVPGSAEEYPFRVVVTASASTAAGSRIVARAAAIADFSAGRTTLLPLVLTDLCDDAFCGCEPDDEACTQVCRPTQRNGASCVDVPEYTRLPEVSPGDELDALARGAGACSPGEMLTPDNRCEDLDECAFGLHECDDAPFACENEVSGAYGYACRCPANTRGNGVGELGCTRDGS